MKIYPGSPLSRPRKFMLSERSTHGGVLITALILAIIIAITLISALKVSKTSLTLAHRTFFADAVNNMAETGLEEAVWSFNDMGSSYKASSWSGWTLGNTVTDVYISSKGSGYTSAPTVTFSGGGGSGAAGTAVISTYYQMVAGVDTAFTGVTGITITNPGSGYTSAPSITLSGGGGTLAGAVARLAATRSWTFNNLDQNASGKVNVWVAGYDGTAAVPIIVAKATITPLQGPKIEKYIKVIMSKNGVLVKGVVAKLGINWNGHPLTDSFKSSTTPGVPPFTAYDPNTARPNTVLASVGGTIDLANGDVHGDVMYGSGVSVTGGTVTGQKIPNFTYDFTYPTVPTNVAGSPTAGIALASIPAVLPRATETTPNADGNFYYYVNGVTIGNVTITAGKKVVIVGTGGTNMNIGNSSGIKVPSSGSLIGKATVYMDGPITISGNGSINTIASPNTSWAGALDIYTSTSSDISFSGNATFYGSIFAPNASLTGNGGGNNSQDLSGAFVVKSITSNGHMSLHFDEGLQGQTPAKPWALALWTELQSAADRAIYASKLNF